MHNTAPKRAAARRTVKSGICHTDLARVHRCKAGVSTLLAPLLGVTSPDQHDISHAGCTRVKVLSRAKVCNTNHCFALAQCVLQRGKVTE